jgi:mitofusin
MSGLLPAEKRQVSLNVLPRRKPFEKFNRPKWDDLCADFREDLDFKFSLVSRSIISSFAGKKANSTALTKRSQRVSML